MKKNYDNTLSRLHTVPKRNGRTDRRTDRFAISVSHVSMLRSLLADTLMTSMMIIQMLISLDVFMVMYYSWSCMMHELFVAADCWCVSQSEIIIDRTAYIISGRSGIERRSLTGELSLSCARLTDDCRPLCR